MNEVLRVYNRVQTTGYILEEEGQKRLKEPVQFGENIFFCSDKITINAYQCDDNTFTFKS